MDVSPLETRVEFKSGGPSSLEGFEFCQLTFYLALAIRISFSLSKAPRLIKLHKATNRKQSSAGHLARKSHLSKIGNLLPSDFKLKHRL